MKESKGAREARMRRNKAKRKAAGQLGPINGRNYRETMVRKRVMEKRQVVSKAYATAYAKVLIAISKEYYDGEVKYAALRAKEPQVGAECKIQVEQGIAKYLRIPKSEQTPQLLAEACDVIQELHEQFIKDGKLVPQNLNLWEVPQARVYNDGRVEPVNRVRDMDIKDMGARYLKAQQEVDEKLKG